MSRLKYALEVLDSGECPRGKKANSFSCYRCSSAKLLFGDSSLCGFKQIDKKGETRRKEKLAQPNLFNNGPGTGNGSRF